MGRGAVRRDTARGAVALPPRGAGLVCVLASPGPLPRSARVRRLFVLLEVAATHCCKESPAAKCACTCFLTHLRVKVRACLPVAVHRN